MTRLTREQYTATVMARVKGVYDDNAELLKAQYPTWQEYFAWVMAMMEADFILQSSNQKDLAGLLLAGAPAFTYDHAVVYIADQYSMIVDEEGADDEYIDEGIKMLDERLKDILGAREEDDEHF